MATLLPTKIFLYDLIASQPNIEGQFHGGGKYCKKVFFELLKHVCQTEWKIYCLYTSESNLDDEINLALKESNVMLIDISKTSLQTVVEDLNIVRLYSALPFGLIKYGLYDLFHSKCVIYSTIHGLRYLEVGYSTDELAYVKSFRIKLKVLLKVVFNKKLFARDRSRYKILIENTNVMAVSNHTKFSIMAYFPEIKKEISVFYSPDVTEFDDPVVAADVENFNMRNYFLLISGNRWLKNNLSSVLALDELFSERPDIGQKVIITGVSDSSLYLKRIKNKSKFVFFNYVSEGFLNSLYKNAFAFIYMTLNEGFGYPPLDAMKLRVPVITCPFTSITEVCENAVLYANPYSIKEIKSRVIWLLDSCDKYKELQEKSFKQYNLIYERQISDLNKQISFLLN